MWIGVVTFNSNEATAVDRLLSDLASGAPSPWRRAGQLAIERDFGAENWKLEHFPLMAQGNVVAAAELARLFNPRRKVPDFVVFYGCAGVVDPADARSVFLVQSVNYLSLGTVDPDGGGEKVTLKNKWLCHIDGADAAPLPATRFPLCSGSGSFDIRRLTGLPSARVAATDKVVRVGAGSAPPPISPPPPHDIYGKEEWTYGQALGLVTQVGGPVLVEMESYGISRVAHALDILERVVVLRITTDTLTNHQGSSEEQLHLLLDGRTILGHLLAHLFEPTLGPR